MPEARDMNNFKSEVKAVEKIVDQLHKKGELMESVMTKLDILLLQANQIATRIENQHRESYSRTEALIRELKEEIVLQDERLLLKFGTAILDDRSATVEAIQNSVDVKMNSFSEKLQPCSKEMDLAERKALNDEVFENIKATVTSAVVPALDSICSSLFQQLTETFRTGLEQFLCQVRNLQLETAKASSSAITSSTNNDFTILVQLIENGQISSAFEKALSQKDLTSLMFVCDKVNPDVLFGAEQVLPQSVLLCILKKLGSKLEGETDLKFRYIENSLMALNLKDPTTAAKYRPVLEYLHEAFLSFMAKESNSSYKRQTRIILQLIVNMLR